MMPYFGTYSRNRLAGCHIDIQRLLNEAIKHVDFAVTCGHRGQVEQERAFAEGKSTVHWPDSKHNMIPSVAVDVAPYCNGILWDDLEGFTLLAGVIKGIAYMMGIKIRLGIDWDSDGIVKEHSFKDRPHIELVL